MSNTNKALVAISHMIESLRLAPMRPLDPALFPDVFRKTATTKDQP